MERGDDRVSLGDFWDQLSSCAKKTDTPGKGLCDSVRAAIGPVTFAHSFDLALSWIDILKRWDTFNSFLADGGAASPIAQQSEPYAVSSLAGRHGSLQALIETMNEGL